MKKYLVIILLIILGFTKNTIAQELSRTGDKLPEYPGGINALMKYLGKEISYPKSMLSDTTFTEETIYIDFIINEKGNLTKVKAQKRNKIRCKECMYEAIRVVKAMKNWKPGIQDGIPVAVFYTLPVKFSLTD